MRVGMKKRTLRSNQETDEGKRCAALANSLTKKAPYKGLGAESEEKQEPASDIGTGVVDGLKVLDPERPIREAAVSNRSNAGLFNHLVGERKQRRRYSQTEHSRGLSVDNQLDLGPLHCRQAER
jgi:hypothetical protein